MVVNYYRPVLCQQSAIEKSPLIMIFMSDKESEILKKMKAAKKKRLKAMGFAVGSAAEFLRLSKDETRTEEQHTFPMTSKNWKTFRAALARPARVLPGLQRLFARDEPWSR